MRTPRTLLLAALCAAVASLCFVQAGSALAQGQDAGASGPDASTSPALAPPEDYRIAEEDVLRMDVWGEPQLSSFQMQVTPDGKVNVPYLGTMRAAGLTLAELTDQIAKGFEDLQILVSPRVQITLMTMHQPTVRVVGQVNRPGSVTFKEGDTILDAIAQAGSYTADALLEKATLAHKGSDTTIPLDLKKMFAGDLTQNYELRKGDKIYIPPQELERKIYVLGQVMRPGVYDLKDNTRVLSAVTLAGGPTERGALRSTVVVRGNPSKPDRVPCDLTRLFDKADLAQDILLEPGDLVMVPETRKPNWQKISQLLGVVSSVSVIRRYGLF